MEINIRFLQTFSLVVTYLKALKKTWLKEAPWKLSSKPKTSHFTIVITFKFDPLIFTYAIIF